MLWKGFTGLLAAVLVWGLVGMEWNWIASSTLAEVIASQTGEEPFVLSGTMRLLDIQGGCWVLETAEGKRFQLDGTPEQLHTLRRDGARVTIYAVKAPDRYGTCMIGTWVKVIQIMGTG
ncbi:hypothetical protein [Desmospora activa]|uniref:Uncharacterized protein n=1 Tax=Desmospora activa DSM 45169 TaxID=1121389 RepID=A0A2T4Z9A0_9BACL|nr:hypothetical protein [Desmospora activa]PTM58450.1 hypothetical protein C8J48_1033 [Desmospora activa DSM 45169]